MAVWAPLSPEIYDNRQCGLQYLRLKILVIYGRKIVVFLHGLISSYLYHIDELRFLRSLHIQVNLKSRGDEYGKVWWCAGSASTPPYFPILVIFCNDLVFLSKIGLTF